ncbi:hypothetical protein GF377_10700 [candidate division GN15 bacterium]|nr:hypothetical protein [candidate division GN15 bacterium]
MCSKLEFMTDSDGKTLCFSHGAPVTHDHFSNDDEITHWTPEEKRQYIDEWLRCAREYGTTPPPEHKLLEAGFKEVDGKWVYVGIE